MGDILKNHNDGNAAAKKESEKVIHSGAMRTISSLSITVIMRAL